MPIYVYQASDSRGCDHCLHGFELLQKISDPAVPQCPRCQAPVRKLVSAPSLGSTSTALSKENLEQHGFTQYRKSGKGVYEKTAGKGPHVISDKQR
ncbi:MAG: FmdB family transcriptional regulator [Xanthomonadales bacterium]|nr:FmdB family transcriptional regulator [Xanthomonadales bacterium]NIN74040.1 FmdB family transcriptional regulator [Xanthomonadales bacterium]NIO12426.1 FmdB family transcriptional regulator [Xanthomonadales bacterium]NIP11165.1 FmdB family transcriptional regulator [Xanthomonadales bacterium]NIP74671.1 FmdB family transcriptional regulator [Xanthomonadales bacterium]